ncbi:helix-turn-helix domain-containing protein [Mycobacterium sp. 852002-51163_SCH5372311]|uniref:helix-turn-helix domain-containing protein n=1 Tax=Mycobacterium sp. 852002-51163_SCH5372311 TaxID=1834097 RepID=UPI0009EEEFE1|nr:helix-turn-helix domain-containing protein [Mycobacterium sp. 852002-51163_SCH5372311]
MSWSALAWATDSDVGPTTTKFILILLANKADENFSCYPSVRTLMTEANASRSTVLRALKNLEARGYITRRPQFHDSGARRSSRYYLNHPRAPHVSPQTATTLPSLGLTLPRLDLTRAPSPHDTGTVSERHPTGVSQRDPLNPSCEPPSEPGDDAARILETLTRTWKLRVDAARSLLPSIESALARGWPATDLAEQLTRNPDGVRDPVRVLARRLGSLGPVPNSSIAAVPWCGECEDAHSRTITVIQPGGTEAARFCPQCSPQVHRPRPCEE